MRSFGTSLAPSRFFPAAKWGNHPIPFLSKVQRAWSCGFYNLRFVNGRASASLTSYPSVGKEDGEECIFKGRPARNRVVFINLSGARRREGKAPENRASLTWPYACVLPAASSHEGRTTPSRCLPLMKTTQFLAGPLEICAHPRIGGRLNVRPLLPAFRQLIPVGAKSPSQLTSYSISIAIIET